MEMESTKIKLIYEGYKSLIYVREQDDLLPVAIKTIKQEYPTLHQITRLYNEYEILKSLKIEGVLKVKDKDPLSNKPSFAMGYFDGEQITRMAPVTKESLGDFLEIAINITHTLGKIHDQHIIHKDINPNNILVNFKSNEIKIIDFGISSRINLKHQYSGNPDRLEGTLAYISPEQTGRMNRVVDYRTDLYSLGITFYETLTGKLPFPAYNSLELVHCHLAQIAEAPHLLNPAIPKILSDMVMKLMRKNAENRYQSAYILEGDLKTCQQQFQHTQSIAPFEIARQNFSRIFKIPEKSYGREQEEQLLMQAFERTNQGTNELVLVTGYSGVGKSALINEIHKALTEKKGYFISGKYEQFQRNIPYFAINQALNNFINQLLTENKAALIQWKAKILQAVGSNGQVLIDVLPSLETIIDKQPPIAPLGAAESQNRFNLVFQQFLRVISRKEHPLVMFIDDLQWADSASLNLLRVLMEDTENQYLLIIGAYRDNEVYERHPLIMTLEYIEKTGAAISTIVLQSLAKEHVHELITDTLHSSRESTVSLTELVYHKTLGNAFFVRQFLTSLYEEGLISFNTGDTGEVWTWDMKQIEAKNITDNVIDLMADKIQRLSPETQHTLRLAASIGDQFNLKTLTLIYKQNAKKTLEDLWSAIAEELVLPMDTNYSLLLNPDMVDEGVQDIDCQFRFLHNRVQQAAYSLIPDDEKRNIHYQIGHSLLGNSTEEQLEEKIFDVINHLNMSVGSIENAEEKIELARLNLFAAQKAKEATAYQVATEHLNVAVYLLPDNCWEAFYRLTCDIYLEKAECEYLNTNFEATIALYEEITAKTSQPLDLARIYDTIIVLYTNLGNMAEAVKYCKLIVGILDEPIPEKLEKVLVKVQQKVRFIEAFLKDKKIENLADLPTIEDAEKIALMNILVKSVPPAYETDQALVALIVTTMVETSFKYGNSVFSAYGYDMFAILQGAMLHDYPASYRFGQVAIKLVNKLNAVALKGAVYFVFGNFVSHWGQELDKSLDILKEGFQRSIEGGDHIHTGYCASRYLMYSVLHGHALPKIYDESNEYIDFLRRKSDLTCSEMSAAIRQMILCLQGKTSDLNSFDGEVFKEAMFVKIFSDNLFSLSHFYLLKIMTYYIFGEYKKAYQLLPVADKVMPGSTGSYVEVVYNFYNSLVTIAVIDKNNGEQVTVAIEKVTKNQQRMKMWADSCPDNYLHLYCLAEAEKNRLKGQNFEAIELYHEAVELAHAQKFIHIKAIANELLAVFWLNKNKPDYAKRHLKKAYYSYKIWGADAKLLLLSKQYGDDVLPTEENRVRSSRNNSSAVVLHKANAKISESSQSTQSTGASLDMASIVKASQALSEEVRINHLIGKMLHIVIENAGAEKGVLINVEKDLLEVVAEGDPRDVTLLENRELLDESLKVPQSIINYVSRTQKYLVLDDISKSEEFSKDTYIQRHQPKSVLCFSVLRGGELSCIFYLENNLTNHAFTDDRIRLLKILSVQMATSLENAILYDSLEQKVTERTNDLNDALTDVKITNMKIMDSIRYAKHIQMSILPSDKDMAQCFQDHFVLFIPKDVVSGDFYWLSEIDGYTFIVVLDCTGHGVPGAFMSMVGNTLLNEIINEKRIYEPTDILNELHLGVEKALRQKETDNSDGMDLCLCRLEPQDKDVMLTFSGAKRPLFYVTRGEMGQIKGDRKSIAGWRGGAVKHFTQHKLLLNKGDLLYLSTDGFADTPNPRRRSYGQRRLAELLSNIRTKSLKEQKEALAETLRTHQSGVEQRDDITIMGLMI